MITITNDQIIESLKKGQPSISIVRAGDGEGIILNAMTSIKALTLASEAVLKRQLGYEPPINEVRAIRDNLVQAYTYCDVIGLPNHKQETNGHWKQVETILNNNVPNNPKNICDIDAAYQLMYDDSYTIILRNRGVLNYISCRDLDEGFKSRFGLAIVNKYTIAPEQKFTSGYDGELHYPTQFNRIPRWMDVMLERHPGSLLLVGAGVVGKIYCNWWRDRGGLAMDVGGVMDCWAGRVTRGSGKGLDKEDLTYKL